MMSALIYYARSCEAAFFFFEFFQENFDLGF